jgi:hypothetical protein
VLHGSAHLRGRGQEILMTVTLLADEQVAVLAPEIEALTIWLAYKAFADKYFGPAAARLKVEIENQAL